MPNRHVVPSPRGGWDTKEPNDPTPKSHHRTQGGAEDAAKRAVHQEGGGQVIIHRPDGTIRDADTVAPARDPYPPKDIRH